MKMPERDWPFRWDSTVGAWEVQTYAGPVAVTETLVAALDLDKLDIAQVRTTVAWLAGGHDKH